MPADFSKPSKEIVVAAINAAQSTNVLPDEVSISVTASSDSATAVTLLIAGVTYKPYKGSKSVSFNRILLSALGVGISPLTGSTVTAGYLVSGVNAIYGINLSMSEVTIDGVSYQSTDNINMAGKNTFVIAAKSSLLWAGSMIIGFRPTA